MVRLPISGSTARWRTNTGYDDIQLAEGAPGLRSCAEYATIASIDGGGAPVDPLDMPVGDLDLLIVAHRRDLLGDEVTAEAACRNCGATVDISFSLAAFVDHHRPRSARSAKATGAGWWRVHDSDFRLPTVSDVLAVLDAPTAASDLLGACVRGTPDAAQRRAIANAMSKLAPTLRATVAGSCPECLADLAFDVDARELSMADLRMLANHVFSDVHVIASQYGWSQEAILSLPSARRRAYAELIGGSIVPGAVEASGVFVG